MVALLYSLVKRPWNLVFLILSAPLLIPPAFADDTEIYTDLQQCSTVSQEKYRFVFIVDNSGSMSPSEFTASRRTINATITEVLNSDLNDIKVAVVQYGTQHWTREHTYNITVPFTDDAATATNWNRHYGTGSPNWRYFQDHQPGSLSKMRRDNVYAAGGALDVSEATNVQFVFFTDALRDYYNGCCSSLVSTGSPHHNLAGVLPGFGEYDVLKDGSILPNGIKGQFTILHVPPGGSWYAPASRAAAAIASPGGNYTGQVEYNAGDPEGPGSKPRRYIQGTFAVSDTTKIVELIKQVIEEVKTITFTNNAPAISVNAFNQLRHRNELYYGVFQPSTAPKWGGNVKKYSIGSDGVILDANGSPAIDPATGSIKEDARSYWSSEVDGNEVNKGGFRSMLSAARTVYTDASALESGGSGLVSVQANTPLRFDSMGLGSVSGSICEEAADRVANSITVSRSATEVETGLPVDGATDVKLTLTTSGNVRTEVRAKDLAGNPISSVCQQTYTGGSAVQECTATLPASASSIDLVLEALAPSSTSFVEYALEYNIDGTAGASVCTTLADDRTDLLNWVRGVDVFNEDGDSSFSDPNLFAADPLHAKPFVITYAGSSAATAKDVVFEADNLGSLRAIDPSDGDEIWSYIPEQHLDNLRKYALNKAGSPKPYGLDGEISIVQREASSSTPSSFLLREVTLYIGERRGGRNYYAIDASNAHIGTAPSVDWKILGGVQPEFSDLGQTWSEMIPAKIKTSCNSLGESCTETEVLIFSGGYDEAYDIDGPLPTNTIGNAIYIVDLATGGQNFFWSAGNNSDDRSEHTHKLGLAMNHSIAASPSVIDSDGDGAVDMLFAIDVSGDIWRVDFDNTKSAASNQLATGGRIADLSPSGENRRFYAPLDISRSDPSAGDDRFNIVVGSGYRAHPNNLSEPTNRIYVVYDQYTSKRRMGSAAETLRYKYVAGGSGSVIQASDLVNVDSLSGVPSYGYYKDLSGNGEKILQSAVTFNNVVIVSSFMPAQDGDSTCGVGGGRTYFLNLGSGKSVFSEEWVDLKRPGLPPEATVLHLPNIVVCIGTECVTPEPVESDDSETDECEEGNYDPDSFDSALQAAVSAAACGLEKGRAFRTHWRENR